MIIIKTLDPLLMSVQSMIIINSNIEVLISLSKIMTKMKISEYGRKKIKSTLK